MKERRKSHRLRAYLGGRISFDNRFSTLDCLVRNLSQNGAKLVFAGPVVLPFEFDIHIRNKGESCRGRLIWCDETNAGIILSARDFGSIISIETARRIRKLEADRDALAKRVAELSEPQ
jgi:PilZ domain